MSTPSERRAVREHTVPALIHPPSHSIIWIAMWFLIGLVGVTLLVAVGPTGLTFVSYNVTAIRGTAFWVSVPITALLAIVLLTISAVRRAPGYRQQQASPEGRALQHDMDVALAAKPRIALQIVGLVLTVIFALLVVFVLLELATEKLDFATVDIETIALLLVGLPAAGTLGAANRRRASARRLAADVP
jgi:uncharacterized membrane protein